MKIVRVSLRLSGGGAEEYVRSTSLLLAKAGCEIVILHADPGARPVNGVVDCYFPEVADLLRNGGPDGRKAYEAVLAHHPDMVDLNLVTPLGSPGLVQSLCQDIPTVWTIHTQLLTCPGYRRVWIKEQTVCQRDFGLFCLYSAYRHHCNLTQVLPLWQRWTRVLQTRKVARHAKRLVAYSQFMVDTLRRAGFPDKQVALVPMPIIPESAPQDSDAPVTTDNTILFVGRVSAEKGLSKLFEASRLIQIPHQILVVGDGPAMQDAKSQASQLGIEKRVHFTGWVDRVTLETIYQKTCLVVVPSVATESFGRVGAEALLAGVPVVTFDLGAVRSWLEDGKSGYLIPPFDVEELAHRIEYLLTNRQIARSMGQYGRQTILSSFSSERVVIDQLLPAYFQRASIHAN